MSLRGSPAPAQYLPEVYWEERARRFAAEGEGLAAVCSYGMPPFYNRVIHFTQYLALSPWLRVQSGCRALDVGCGVGRWSALLAARGASVVGVDLSPTMIAHARQRLARTRHADRCRFIVQDIAQLDTGGHHDLVLGVTVLQHIVDPTALRVATERLAAHLAPGGRLVLLEAAPTRFEERCDTSVFRARQRLAYLRLFEHCGLRLRALTGVDPAPFRTWLLPRLPRLARLSRHAARVALGATAALSVTVDMFWGRRAVERSWHALFVLERA
jgi:2-polyprenyl-3-methyl-5-hydroxy-6-metoxy-1,4-benzoquinol methylase